MDDSLRDRLRAVSGADSLETLTQTLLAVLESITDLDSVYLTRIDEDRRFQHVLFARNRRPRRIEIPEGLSVPWEQTVCRRALAEGTPTTARADELWGDLAAVRALGIRTYVSEPVRDASGGLMGTLCAVSDRPLAVDDDIRHVVGLFSRLIAHQIEREQRLARLEHDNEELASRVETLAVRASTDPLTGLANRAGLMAELKRALARAARVGGHVGVAFVDLDRFKRINDLYGHRAGDRFLVAMAGRLAATTRAGETVARYGGDEFVAVVSWPGADGDEARLAERFAEATRGSFDLGPVRLDYGGASVGVATARPGEDAEGLLGRADAAMYAAKKANAWRHGPETAPRALAAPA